MRLVTFAPLAVVGLVIALPPTGGELRPIPLNAPQMQAPRPLALVWQKNRARLATLNPKTLRVGKQRTSPLGGVNVWAFERPDSRFLAISISNWTPSEVCPPDVIRFIDLHSLRILSG